MAGLCGKGGGFRIIRMRVIATHLMIASGKRGRLCVRPDGLWQFATETFIEPNDEYDGYWRNEHPPSGIFSSLEEAVAALRLKLSGETSFSPTEPQEISLSVGPWPDPIPDEQ